jgi:hypothetical protein
MNEGQVSQFTNEHTHSSVVVCINLGPECRKNINIIGNNKYQKMKKHAAFGAI